LEEVETRATLHVFKATREPMMKTSKAALNVKDTGERWMLLLLAMSVVIGLAMLPQ
jgi:hypothetical protein